MYAYKDERESAITHSDFNKNTNFQFIPKQGKARSVIQRARKPIGELVGYAESSKDWGVFLIKAGDGPYLDWELDDVWRKFKLGGTHYDAFSAFKNILGSYVGLESYGGDEVVEIFNEYMAMGVTTKSEFIDSFVDSGSHDHGYEMHSDPNELDGSQVVIQQKRNPGFSGPKNYGKYKKMLFKKDKPDASIDFDRGLGESSVKKNNKPNSFVNLALMMTNGKINQTIYDPHKKKTVACPRAGQKFDKENRDQHFAMADMLYYINHGTKPNRVGTWTWHHLPNQYDMVLVDMEVHAKHGHNGGVYIW
ncbi:hypothetical protein PSECIP111951_00915 [Pseudoalteromonas holothuriae]|uniref:Uncharacterized protein n=1 Tax=Pseudoalteromonas holothuriae TaxID=2963714 RepID=A0A9W4QVZ4_9GAMM|nr:MULTISPECIES: HNH endonuclease [unclassified Pseudoalteromonas]CAH9053892.1 hypothetical protein PSECIP111951_00915 [Pseudoalteromonas sp. CIP111951]CAH9055722.1 hypothetical protein PSECIP111854_01635 [Pseudoalteromonas sp. CIP111854]